MEVPTPTWKPRRPVLEPLTMNPWPSTSDWQSGDASVDLSMHSCPSRVQPMEFDGACSPSKDFNPFAAMETMEQTPMPDGRACSPTQQPCPPVNCYKDGPPPDTAPQGIARTCPPIQAPRKQRLPGRTRARRVLKLAGDEGTARCASAPDPLPGHVVTGYSRKRLEEDLVSPLILRKATRRVDPLCPSSLLSGLCIEGRGAGGDGPR
uniref:Uncharacterized protein n=1 Tax=Auxenochlorella protothecoides TaxID=3075 RepID=A0A1D1ZWF6_AUXPR